MNSVRRVLVGFLLAFIAGFSWGSMGVAAQVMMNQGFSPQDLVVLRVFGAGVVLTIMVLLAERDKARALLTDLILLRDIVIYGISVLAAQFTFFFCHP